MRAHINISLHDLRTSAFKFRCIGIVRPEARACTCGTQRYPVTLTACCLLSMQVYRLLESIEIVVRGHLNITRMAHECTPGDDLRSVIITDILQNDDILCAWEEISAVNAHVCNPKYVEQYSLELLKYIVGLWVDIRVHSFAKGCTMNGL